MLPHKQLSLSFKRTDFWQGLEGRFPEILLDMSPLQQGLDLSPRTGETLFWVLCLSPKGSGDDLLCYIYYAVVFCVIYAFILFFLNLLIFGCIGSSFLHAGFSLVAVSLGYSSLQWLLLLQSTGSRRTGFSSCGSWALEHRLSSCGPRA